MSRQVRLAVIVGLAVALLIGSGATSVHGDESYDPGIDASIGLGHAATSIEQQTRDYLREHPSAALNADGSIQAAPGVRMYPPKTDKGGDVILAGARTDCRYYYLCVWQDSYYQGWSMAFYYCGLVYLRDLIWPGQWPGMFVKSPNNSISSLVNNQTPGTVSVFWDYTTWNGLPTGPYFSQIAYGYRDNLVIDGWNDRISLISVC